MFVVVARVECGQKSRDRDHQDRGHHRTFDSTASGQPGEHRRHNAHQHPQACCAKCNRVSPRGSERKEVQTVQSMSTSSDGVQGTGRSRGAYAVHGGFTLPSLDISRICAGALASPPESPMLQPVGALKRWLQKRSTSSVTTCVSPWTSNNTLESPPNAGRNCAANSLIPTR